MRIETANSDAIARAGAILRRGGLVAIPTETVYGIAADAANDNAVAGIFAAKERPRFNPLIVHVRSLDHAEMLATFCDTARRLARTFWPGPLTLVLPKCARAPVSLLATAGLDTIALRVPAHPTARELLDRSQLALAAPSANRSGSISSTSAVHVASSLGGAVDLILDAGRAEHGIESTIVGLNAGNHVLLRPGALPRERIEALIGRLAECQNSGVTSPGQLARHYAPKTPLRLNATELKPDEGLLAFGTPPMRTAQPVRNLSPASDLREAAANLFAMLRELDDAQCATIAVMPIPEHGLGEAINDRLRRAAAPEQN